MSSSHFALSDKSSCSTSSVCRHCPPALHRGGKRSRDSRTDGPQDASVLQEEEAQRGVPEEAGISAVPGKNRGFISNVDNIFFPC